MRNQNQKIIILEGIDKSGKSFIGKLFQSVFGIPYYHGERSPASREELKTRSFEVAKIEMMQMYDILKQTGISIIIDRWHLSELVYGKVYGRQIDENFIWDMDEKLADLGAVIVYVSAPLEVLKIRWNREKLIDFEEVKNIIDQYEKSIKKSKCKIIYYNPFGEY